MRRSERLAEQAKARGLEWGGWDEAVYRWRVGDAELKTLNDVEKFIEAIEYVQVKRVTADRVDAERMAMVNRACTTYRAEKGDSIVIDRGDRVEVTGWVLDVEGETVVVRATRVTIEGQVRPDLVGTTWRPLQNGSVMPWGLTQSLTKV